MQGGGEMPMVTWPSVVTLTVPFRGGRMRICGLKEKKENSEPREGWEDGTPPPHRDFKVS